MVTAIVLTWNAISPPPTFAGQGASRMLYTVPNSTFIEKTSGESVTNINDASGSIATLQTTINNTRSANPNSIIVIRLTNSATYWVSNASLVLGARTCLVASGATIKATNSSVTVPLIQIASGSTNVSVAGGRLDGNGANINGIYAPAADRVNVANVTVLNCGLEGILLNGNGNTNFDNQLAVARCDVSGCLSNAGISIQNATQAACIENYSHGNGTGIRIGTSRSTFANNVCNNNGTGIHLAGGNDNVLANNTCNGNATGILAEGTNTMIVSHSLGGNTIAGINAAGSKNIYLDNLFTSGNGTNFLSNGFFDRVVAYQAPLDASGQIYFYPPLINDPHTNVIVNGLGRTDLTIGSTNIDAVQVQYDSARAANPTNVIVLHLDGTFTVGATPLTLSSNTCILLNGTIQVTGSTTASKVIEDGISPARVSISGGILDGGGNTNIGGVSFLSGSMVQVDSVRLQNFGPPNPRGASDVIRFKGAGTPMIVTRSTITNGSARGIWLQQSTGKCLVSDNDVSAVNMDGVDCDSFTSGAVVKFNYVHDVLRDGVFVEQGASHNVVLGNICTNITNKGINLYNNAITNNPVQYNSIIGNWCHGGNGLRNGSTPSDSFTSHNFFFNNTLINAAIQSQNRGTENYYSQNYLIGGSVSISGTGAESFFNPPDVDGYLTAQDANSYLFAVVTNASVGNGAAVILGATNSLGSDRWQLVPTDSGYFQIKNKNSSKVMNVTGASTNSGALISQQTFGAAKSDQWMPVSAGNGFYHFLNRLSGLYLAVGGAGTTPGTQLDQQPSTGAASQQFNLNATPLTPTVATVTLSNLSQTYDGTGKSVSVTTSPTNLAVTVTYNGVGVLPTNAGSYQAIAVITEPRHVGGATNTLVISKATAVLTVVAGPITYGQTLASSSLSGSTATNALNNTAVPGSFAYTTPSILPYAGMTNVGVAFTPADTNYFSATNTTAVTVNPAPATVTLGNLNQTYDGTSKSVTVTTSPTNLATTVTYNGSPVAPTNVGSYQVMAVVADSSYTGGATNTLVISQAFPTAATNLTYLVIGGSLQLQWPPNYIGWILQSQTNALPLGISTNWVDVPGSSLTNQWFTPLNQFPTVFFRLRFP